MYIFTPSTLKFRAAKVQRTPARHTHKMDEMILHLKPLFCQAKNAQNEKIAPCSLIIDKG
jgi:hypothetical protein